MIPNCKKTRISEGHGFVSFLQGSAAASAFGSVFYNISELFPINTAPGADLQAASLFETAGPQTNAAALLVDWFRDESLPKKLAKIQGATVGKFNRLDAAAYLIVTLVGRELISDKDAGVGAVADGQVLTVTHKGEIFPIAF